ncbi:MAG: hypothetical protein ACYC7B_06015 [Burkholderiales bacterium]
MNKYQRAMLIVAAINLLLILLFPPYDYFSYARENVPTFDGFLFVFGAHPNGAVNRNFLAIEIVVVLINTTIAWLLLHERARLRRRPDRQNLVLLGVALNLLLALLFPPFQDHYIASKALLPSFDGFYFVFADNSMRVVVATMLWVEIMFILINGAMLWMMFHRPAPRELTAAERFAQPAELLGSGGRRKT